MNLGQLIFEQDEKDKTSPQDIFQNSKKFQEIGINLSG